jgi:hypothetical protein
MAGLTALLLVASAIATVAAPAAKGADPQIRLAVEPVGANGQFFQLTMRAGESIQLTVDLANYGPASVRARTYAADVYSLINGGFGARLRDEAQSGTTTWLEYTTNVLVVEPNKAVRRTFRLAVPATTTPGEYITSLVLENEEPLSAGAGVAFQQFVRSATAVVVTVPGIMTAGLALGDARHSFFQGRSVVDVLVENTGNERLKPVGRMTITTEGGTEVDTRNVMMDSVYAGTSTSLEVVLDRPLAPGRYFANVELADQARGGPASGARPFTVGELVVPPPAAPSGESLAPTVLGTAASGNAIDGILAPVLALVIGALTMVAIVGLLAWRRRRRRGD